MEGGRGKVYHSGRGGWMMWRRRVEVEGEYRWREGRSGGRGEVEGGERWRRESWR